jgi:hypothetical protein
VLSNTVARIVHAVFTHAASVSPTSMRCEWCRRQCLGPAQHFKFMILTKLLTLL